MKKQIRIFLTMEEKKITTWQIVNFKIKIKQVKLVDFATSMLQIALYLQDVIRTLFARYTRPQVVCVTNDVTTWRSYFCVCSLEHEYKHWNFQCSKS